MKLSVVIPARNEEGTVGPTVDSVRGRLRCEGIDYEIIVVDDGSSDRTPNEILARCREDPNVRMVSNTGPYGFGYAVSRGLDTFQGDAVAIMMADGSDDVEDLLRYFSILKDRAECAFGSRFIRGGKVEGYPKFKLIINRLANTIVRLLFGIGYNDVTNAFKGYRANVIHGCLPLLSRHFNLTVELPLKAIVRGYSFEVIPIRWRQRDWGRSALHLKEMGSRYLFIVLYVWLEKLLCKRDYRRVDEVASDE
jgi:dolichol-phosphate mannosyltransferase